MDQEIRLPILRLPPDHLNDPRPISTLPIFSASAKMSRYKALPALASSSTCKYALTRCFRSRGFLFLITSGLGIPLKNLKKAVNIGFGFSSDFSSDFPSDFSFPFLQSCHLVSAELCGLSFRWEVKVFF